MVYLAAFVPFFPGRPNDHSDDMTTDNAALFYDVKAAEKVMSTDVALVDGGTYVEPTLVQAWTEDAQAVLAEEQGVRNPDGTTIYRRREYRTD